MLTTVINIRCVLRNRIAPMKLNALWKKEKLAVKLKCWSRQNEGRFAWAENMLCTQYRNLCTSETFFKRRKTTIDGKIELAVLPKSKFKETQVTEVWKNMTVSDLAKALGKNVQHVFDVLEYVENGRQYNKPTNIINNWKVIQDVVKLSGMRCKLVSPPVETEILNDNCDAVRRPPVAPKNMKRRPPIVTVMGHVDHGKTTLLDTLRNTSVADSEFGGITQHIGAFCSTLKSGEKITFLDTPGHAAFSAMRSRGAQITDIVVLVVAADDGVMEQTTESIRMAKEAKVPILVAINKIDKPEADIEKTKRMLAQQGVLVEDLGGDIQAVPISALKGTNIDTLTEAIILQAEIMDIKADYEGFVEGVVIESSNDIHRGKLATVLVDRGTLKKGTILVAGLAWARVRSMFTDSQGTVQDATPGMAVQVIGWRNLPSPGDIILEVESERRAQEVIRWRQHEEMKTKQEEDLIYITAKEMEHQKVYKASLEERRRLGRYKLRRTGPRKKEIEDDTDLKLRIIFKGDVDGSVEAFLDILETYTSSLCKLDVVHYGVGNVTVTDIELAETFQAIIYTFNIGVLRDAQEKAKQKSIKIKQHRIIYKLIDDVKEEIESRLPLIEVEEVLGEANVLQQFLINEGKKKVPVAGCRCTKGILKRNALYKLIRENEVIHEGPVESMRHLKTEVDSIKKDAECGLRLADISIQFTPGDTLICYVLKKQPQKIDWDPGF